MHPLPPPLAFFLLLFSGWVNRRQQAVIDDLLVRGRRRLADIAGIVTPDTRPSTLPA